MKKTGKHRRIAKKSSSKSATKLSKRRTKSNTTSKRTRKTKTGQALLKQVVRLTGIPSLSIQKELVSILEKKNIDVHNLTLDQLRQAAASYVREIMGGILDKYSPRRGDLSH